MTSKEALEATPLEELLTMIRVLDAMRVSVVRLGELLGDADPARLAAVDLLSARGCLAAMFINAGGGERVL